MEVILLEKVTKLGDLGDKVKVKSGFGRNFLIPHGKAVQATEASIAEFETRRAELQAAADASLALAKARAEAMAELAVTIEVNAGDEGKLFGSIGTKDIADAVTAAGHETQKAEVRMPTGAIREVGTYEITLQFHSDVTTIVSISVVAET